MTLRERLRRRFGPVTMRCEPGRVVLPDGQVKTTNRYGQPLSNPLAEALRNARPGDVIGCRGALPGVSIGGGNPNHDYVAYWPNGLPIQDVAVVTDDGAPQQASISGLTIASDLGGIEGLSFWGLDLRNKSYSRSPVLVAMGHRTGKLAVLSCAFVPEDPNAWNGWGKMWGVRAHGLLDALELIDNDCGDGQEHPVCYTDNLGWRTGRRSRIMYNRVGPRGGGRTCIQLTNRQQSGPSGGGVWDVESNDLRVVDAGGGYAITIVGNPNSVRVKNNRIHGDGNHGGIVFWSDSGHGLYKTEDGFTTGLAMLEGNSIQMPKGEYPHVALSGCREVQILGEFLIQGTKTCFDLWNSYGGPIDNGSVKFIGQLPPLSQYTGFQAGPKIRHRNVTLTPAQIDALALNPAAVQL